METNRFKITLHTAKGQFEELVSGESIELGRNISADLPVMASGVSRSHLKVYVKGKQIMIKDLGSTNGTYIKGERVEPHKELSYSQGDRISLGQAGCFVRIELVSGDVKIEDKHDGEITSVGKKVLTESHIKKAYEDTGLIGSLFGKTNAAVDSSDQKILKRSQAYMNQAEKLVKKRISEAEASIRKGIQKARIQAKDITLEAKKEADTIKAKAQVEKNKMLAEIEDEISLQRSQILKELNEERLQEQKDLADKKANLETEISLAQNQIKKEKREAEALVKGAKDEVASLQKKQKDLNDEIKNFLEKKNIARQKYKEVEIKLSTIDEKHEAKTEALNLELGFVKEELEKQKKLLKSTQDKNKKEETEFQKKSVDFLEEKNKAESILNSFEQEKTKFEEEVLEVSSKLEDLKIQCSHKEQDLKTIREDYEHYLHERDQLEDSIAKNRDEAELRLSEYKKQVELNAKKITTHAQRQADNLLAKAHKQEKEILNQAETALNKSEAKSADILDQAQKTLDSAKQEKEDYLKDVRTLKADAVKYKKQSAETADLKAKEAHEKARLFFEKSKKEAEDLLQETKAKSDELLILAEKEKETYLEDTKKRYEQAEVDYDKKMDSFESYQKSEKEKLKAYIQERTESENAKLEKDLAEVKVLQSRKMEEEMAEQKRILDTYREDYAESWSQMIVFKAQEFFGKDLSEEEQDEAREKLKHFSKSVIMEQNPDEELEVQGLMKFDPAHKERKKKFFKRTAVFASLGLFALMASPYITKSIKEKAQQVAASSAKASEERVAKFEQEREELTTFKPDKQQVYLESYTDRVLYTENYAENELSKDFREEWFLDLDTFFVEELILSDETIVTFISKETNLIKGLVELRESINAQFLEEGVKRMKDLEEIFISEVKGLLKNKEKFEMFESFKKAYFLKTFPLDAERSLANTEEEEVSED